jgi:hypothetical protein
MHSPDMSRYSVFYRPLQDPDPTEEASLELAFAEMQVVVVDAFAGNYLVEGEPENIATALKGFSDWKVSKEQAVFLC